MMINKRQYQIKDEYLSGNLMRKWNVAKDANMKYNGFFLKT